MTNKLHVPRGILIPIGGHEEKRGSPKILERFIELCGGDSADVVVMTSASGKPTLSATEYEVAFTKLTAGRVRCLQSSDCQPNNCQYALATIREATGVFFVGGQPYRVTDALKDTPVHKLLQERYQDGLVLAGTSAGALMMPDIVIMDGASGTHPTYETTEIGPGMGFLPSVLLDVHYAERGRCGRMLSAIAKYPDRLGLGIDEDTALVIEGGDFEVVGGGSVFVFDARTRDYVDYTPPDSQDIALVGVRLHVLPSGSRFNLETRTLTSAPGQGSVHFGKSA
jgi:cyanophycinase